MHVAYCRHIKVPYAAFRTRLEEGIYSFKCPTSTSINQFNSSSQSHITFTCWPHDVAVTQQAHVMFLCQLVYGKNTQGSSTLCSKQQTGLATILEAPSIDASRWGRDLSICPEFTDWMSNFEWCSRRYFQVGDGKCSNSECGIQH